MTARRNDRMMRFALEHELRRRKFWGRRDHLLAAWQVDLLSLRINEVEVEPRERGRRWQRALRPLLGNVSVLGLSTGQVILQTPGRMYAGAAGLVYVVRAVGRRLELVWVIQPPEEGSPEAALIPDSNVSFEAFVLFAARLDAHSSEKATQIEQRIIERRTMALALVDDATRETTERMIGELADATFE